MLKGHLIWHLQFVFKLSLHTFFPAILGTSDLQVVIMLSSHTYKEKYVTIKVSQTRTFTCICPKLTSKLYLHSQLAEDVICHKADLRFVSISGQKVLDSVQGALEQVGGSDPALESTKALVSEKLQDANHRYTTLHTKVRGGNVFWNLV